jgi:hypothetical protein
MAAKIDNPPAIGSFQISDNLMLKRAANGGWMVRTVSSHPAYEGEVVGAYTSADEMLDALRTALTNKKDHSNVS